VDPHKMDRKLKEGGVPVTRRIGFLGVGAWAWFWVATVVFGALRPSYSHVANTISELGAVGTPNATAWNVLGFMLPGVLIAITGAAIALRGTLPDGLAQRIGNAFFCAWFVLMSLKLVWLQPQVAEAKHPANARGPV
jgi:hypothetical membrane protein